MPSPASSDSYGSAHPALPSTPLALAKACYLLPHRLNKANQRHSLSLCVSVDPWWGQEQPNVEGGGRRRKESRV